MRKIDLEKLLSKKEMDKFEKKMQKVRREYRRKAAKSIESAKKFYFTA